MKLKGKIMEYGTVTPVYSVDFDMGNSWIFESSILYATRKSAQQAARRIAKKLGLEIVWEKE